VTAFTASDARNRQGTFNKGGKTAKTGVKAMSIRFPHELAAAAEFAESAVEQVTPSVPAAREVYYASASYDLGLAGEPIRLVVGPGFMPAGAPRKLIPGQTYH
jgi:hypothetical protein